MTHTVNPPQRQQPVRRYGRVMSQPSADRADYSEAGDIVDIYCYADYPAADERSADGAGTLGVAKPTQAMLGRAKVDEMRSLEAGTRFMSPYSEKANPFNDRGGGLDGISSPLDHGVLPPRPPRRSRFSMAALRRRSIALPPKKGNRSYRYLRWNFGSVYRRIFTLAFAINMAVLTVLIVQSVSKKRPVLTYQSAAIATAANLLVALLIRNEYVVNSLFILFGTWPRGLPLRLRCLFAKVYSMGGIHSGCGVAATVWYGAFLVLLILDHAPRDRTQGISAIRSHIYLTTYAIFGMFVTILIFAHPKLRSKMHNWFECVHRFIGWSVLLLFWAQTVMLAYDDRAPGQSPGKALVVNVSFWMLVAITLLVIYPWAHLRRYPVQVEPLSKHCVKLNFNFQDGQYGQAIRLSDAPLKETHAFAVIPNPGGPASPPPLPMSAALLGVAPPSYTACGSCAAPTMTYTDEKGADEKKASEQDRIAAFQTAARANAAARRYHAQQLEALSTSKLSNAGRKGFSVVVSDAGDWTRKIIATPPKHLWTVGTPRFGVMRVAGMFEPVIIIATGSGIAPCLALFAEKPDHPVRVIWSAPNPLETFGEGIVQTVLRSDPDAVIWDTRKQGRPDLVKLAWKMWVDSRREGPAGERDGLLGNGGGGFKGLKKVKGACEAVVIISNQRVTEKVVYGLESRGIAAFGAIFDS